MNAEPIMNKFNKVVALDTVIFYPEHEAMLKKLVHNPVIERVPLDYNQQAKEWELPDGYKINPKANIIIYPSSLPESFDGISEGVHERLETAQCWTEAGLRDNISDQNLYNRVKGADCILTCWTGISDPVLDALISDGDLSTIITWTHEYEHRLNVDKANQAGISTDCVPDYGTDSVAELEFDGLVKLIERNHSTNESWKTDEDITIGVLSNLFTNYRKSDVNEKNTRRGKFSHQFHKIGRALKHYGNFGEKTLDEIIPEQLIEGKSIGILDCDENLDYLTSVLEDGFNMNVQRENITDKNSADFYKFLATNETVVYDPSKLSDSVIAKINLMKSDRAIDIQNLKHYDETLRDKKLGVMGLGRIGGKVARIAESFEMNIQYAGRRKKDVKYNYVDVDELMSTSDIVSLNVTAHKAEGLISKERLDFMQSGAYLLQTSDGNAVDQDALIDKMKSNKIYAALDVYQGLPTTQALGLDDKRNGKIGWKNLANHVLTYRAGWKTQESIRVKTYKLLGHMANALYQMTN